MTDPSTIQVGQLSIRYLLDGSSTASMGMFELTVPPNSNVPPPHSHTENDECVYVLEGKLRYAVGAEVRDLGPAARPGHDQFRPGQPAHRREQRADPAPRPDSVEREHVPAGLQHDRGGLVVRSDDQVRHEQGALAAHPGPERGQSILVLGRGDRVGRAQAGPEGPLLGRRPDRADPPGTEASGSSSA